MRVCLHSAPSALVDELIETNPFDSIRLKKILARDQMQSSARADPFDIEEIEAILDACEREQERNMFQFAFCTGMRPSEYIAQQWPHVNFVMHQLEVAGAYVDGEAKSSAKTEAGLRKIDMRQGALDALKAQQAHTKLAGGLIFLHPVHGEQWAGDKPIRERWCRILLIAGVRYRNPYQTRHTYASNLLMPGANPLYVATQLGHVDTTNFRALPRPDDDRLPRAPAGLPEARALYASIDATLNAGTKTKRPAERWPCRCGEFPQISPKLLCSTRYDDLSI